MKTNSQCCISCIYTDTIFLCKTVKSYEQCGRQHKYLDALLDGSRTIAIEENCPEPQN